MMCQPCTDAGDFWMASQNRVNKTKIREEYRKKANDMHELCTNPNTCPCQHRKDTES